MATNAPVIAKRYSRALWSSLDKSVDAKNISQELHLALESFQNSELWNFLCSPTFSSSDKLELIKKILDKMGASKQASRFLVHLVEAGRINVLAEIVEAFDQKVLDSEGVSVAQVEAAMPLSEKQKNDLSLALSKVFSKKVILKIKEDPSLIAGLRVSIGGKLLDGTLTSNLKNLEKNLLSENLVVA